MYHELEFPGQAPCRSDPGYLRYVVPVQRFESQMRWIQKNGWKGMAVGDVSKEPSREVVITFDDGCRSDLDAARLLRELGYQATFYITFGFLGSPGFLSITQLRELSDLGVEIGSHSVTHAYLPDLDESQLRYEVAESKEMLEQLVGRPVEHFSCPGGRFDRRVAEAVRMAGYKTLATSRPYTNPVSGEQYALGRIPIMRETDLRSFQFLCVGKNLWRRKMADVAGRSATSLFGNGRYDQLRSFFLSRMSSEKHHPSTASPRIPGRNDI